MIDIRPMQAEDVPAAHALRTRPGQSRFVSSVQESLQQAERFGVKWPPEGTAWPPHLIWDGPTLVGFVLGGFGDEEPFRSLVWKLLIDGDHQGKGYGRAAVEFVAQEARRRGRQSLGAFFSPGPDGPEGFWLRLGFKIQPGVGDRETYAVRPL